MCNMLAFFTETIFNFFTLWNAELPFFCPLLCLRFGIVPLPQNVSDPQHTFPIFSHCTSALGYLTCYNVFTRRPKHRILQFLNCSTFCKKWFIVSITEEASSLRQIANIISCIHMAIDLRSSWHGFKSTFANHYAVLVLIQEQCMCAMGLWFL